MEAAVRRSVAPLSLQTNPDNGRRPSVYEVSLAIGDSDFDPIREQPALPGPRHGLTPGARRKLDRWTSGERELTSIARHRHARQ
jgi:hypothetical protein